MGPAMVNWKFWLPTWVIPVKLGASTAITLSVPSTVRLLVSHVMPGPGVAGTIAAKLLPVL